MKIAIEANALSQEKITGVGNVVLHYINELQKIDQENSYYIYSMDGVKHADIVSDNWCEVCFDYGLKRSRINTRERWLRLQSVDNGGWFRSLVLILNRAAKIALELLDEIVFTWKLASSLKTNGVDVYLGTSTYYYPFFFLSPVKKAGILYDLVWTLYPGTMEFGNKIRMMLFTLRNMKKMDLLIAISENTKTDARALLRLETRIDAIPLAADPLLFHRADLPSIAAVRKKYGITKKYILSVCTLEPRKNLKSLIAAYCVMPGRHDCQLVLVGMTGWIGSDFFRDLKDSGVADNILLTGYIGSDELAPIYTGADLFVFPSLYEGFGLPVLEAMQCGCPVITSNTSSVPEVAGDAAIMIDPEDIQGLAASMEQLLTDDSLRREMTEKGLHRSRLFSWSKSAQALMHSLVSLKRPDGSSEGHIYS